MTSPDGTEPYDVVVVGGSQAGLAIGSHLRKMGVGFVILEAGPDVGHVWRSRWDSLKLFTPAQYSSLPGMAFPAARDTYPSRDDVAAYLQTYASTLELPVRADTRVTSLRRGGDGFVVTAGEDVIPTRQVVVATGPFQVPFVPPLAAGLDAAVEQVHSARYRNPDQLPEGRVLVVGGGNSGFQIAEELAATRQVDLAVGTSMPALPQRLMGRDLFWWLVRFGVMKASVDSRIGRRMSERDVLIGSSKKGLVRAGVSFRNRLERAEGRRAFFAGGDHVDVDGVVWATGYRPDFSWIDVPGVTDERGRVVHHRGVTQVEGLMFLGLPWQHTRGSALLGFVKDDAAFIAGRIRARASGVAEGSGPEVEQDESERITAFPDPS
ncbi:MAG TPA: NAD(P)/FAD-dependent oxidoreductase [Actinomycetota bacterium]|nr:NAD(P)/FAD-dependent oxidoreductase [Actinomycetota bacterium]